MRAFKAILPAVLLLGLAAPAHAATFSVNSLSDGNDSSLGNGICAGPGGACTLRAAVDEASASAGSDDIVLGPGTHSLAGRLNVIGHDVNIRGAGARETTIDQTMAGEGTVLLSNLTSTVRDLGVTGGSATLVGGGLSVDVSGSQSVLLERVVIAGNEVVRSGGGYAAGGGLYKGGTGSLTVRSSTINGNRAAYVDPTVPGSAFGGGIFHDGGPLNLVNVTIEGNEARGLGPGAASYGGGVSSIGGATALSYVTVARNAATGDDARGGNLASTSSGQLNVESSIVAYGTADAAGAGCHVAGAAALTSFGRNIDTGSSCAFGAPNLSATDPLLGALADNGGTTPTLLPAATSPAIDAAIGCPTPALDQRGVFRPQGAACDIGAVELVPASGEPPAADLVAPILSNFRISAPRFRTSRATRRTRSLPRSTRLVFHLSEPSLVDLRFERRAPGRRGRSGSCQRPSRANRGRRSCVRWTAAGSLADSLPEGSQSMRFTGNVTRNGRGTTLSAGSYRVRAEATDPAGNGSVPAHGRFSIVG